MSVSSWGPDYPLRDVWIRNNTFGAVPDGYHTLEIDVSAGGRPCEHCLVAGNRAGKPIAVNAEIPGSTILVTGNTMDSADLWSPGWCDDGTFGVAWSANTFRRSPTCGADATVTG